MVSDKDFDKKLEQMSSKYGLKEKQNEEVKHEPNAAESYMLGIGFITHTLVGLFIGYWLDEFCKTSPLFLLIFLFVGFIAGFRNIWMKVK